MGTRFHRVKPPPPKERCPCRVGPTSNAYTEMKYVDRTLDGLRVYECPGCGRLRVQFQAPVTGTISDVRGAYLTFGTRSRA